jgi:hypothetical protein
VITGVASESTALSPVFTAAVPFTSISTVLVALAPVESVAVMVNLLTFGLTKASIPICPVICPVLEILKPEMPVSKVAGVPDWVAIEYV